MSHRLKEEKKSNQSTKKISPWCYFFNIFPWFYIFLIVEILIRIAEKNLYKKGKLHEKIGQ